MSIDLSNILLTGGSGTLGTQIIKSEWFDNLLTPSKKVLDITKLTSINNFFCSNEIDFVIHCAGLSRMAICEDKPQDAIRTNIIGTANLVRSIIGIEQQQERKIRFIHISTDGVYNSKKGNYSETSATIPYNNYGWSKLGSECAVQLLSNYVVIRTRFFNPDNIPFDNSAKDVFSSSIPLNELVEAIHFLLYSEFIGTINVGDIRMSEFDRYKKYKTSLKPCTRADITKSLNFEIAKDASMDIDFWHELKITKN